VQATNGKEKDGIQKDQIGFVRKEVVQCKGFTMFPTLFLFVLL
jgi:hypothetical protein